MDPVPLRPGLWPTGRHKVATVIGTSYKRGKTLPKIGPAALDLR